MNLTLQAYYRRGKEKQPDDRPGHPAVFSYGTGSEIHLITAFSLHTEGPQGHHLADSFLRNKAELLPVSGRFSPRPL